MGVVASGIALATATPNLHGIGKKNEEGVRKIWFRHNINETYMGLISMCRIWLGMRDSNPRSRDQNPVPYHLANPQYLP